MEADRDKIFLKLSEDPYNQLCCDCGQGSPQWASVNNGIFICFNCSIQHRNFGMQISFIRSVIMDSWTLKQLSMMQNGGNSRFKNFMANYGLDSESSNVKYKTKAAEYYRKKVTLSKSAILLTIYSE